MAMPTEDDVSQLIQRARNGELEALGDLLGMYRGYLLLTAESHLSCSQRQAFDASDAVQETFLRAHRRFRDFQGSSQNELLAWLRRILANSIISLARRPLGLRRQGATRERTLCELLDGSPEAAERLFIARDSSPSSQIMRCERAVLLANAMQQLPSHYRQVILLRHQERLPFAEISRQMNRTVDSVEKLWVRALNRLKQQLIAVLEEDS